MSRRHTRSILSRRGRRKISDSFDLNITALLDAMIIILVFLLKSATISSIHFSAVPNLEMPLSRSPDLPPDTPHLVIAPDALIFEDTRILEFVQSADSIGAATAEDATYQFKREDLAEGGRMILPLFEALRTVREQYELLAAKGQGAGAEDKVAETFFGELAIQADKRVNYDVLRRVMYTAASAGYRVYHLLAVRKDE